METVPQLEIKYTIWSAIVLQEKATGFRLLNDFALNYQISM